MLAQAHLAVQNAYATAAQVTAAAQAQARALAAPIFMRVDSQTAAQL